MIDAETIQRMGDAHRIAPALTRLRNCWFWVEANDALLAAIANNCSEARGERLPDGTYRLMAIASSGGELHITVSHDTLTAKLTRKTGHIEAQVKLPQKLCEVQS